MPESSTRWSACTTRTLGRSAKSRLGIPVKLGYKAQILDNDDGVVLDHNVETGNPR
jgi:transposase, IS5 family